MASNHSQAITERRRLLSVCECDKTAGDLLEQ